MILALLSFNSNKRNQCNHYIADYYNFIGLINDSVHLPHFIFKISFVFLNNMNFQIILR